MMLSLGRLPSASDDPLNTFTSDKTYIANPLISTGSFHNSNGRDLMFNIEKYAEPSKDQKLLKILRGERVSEEDCKNCPRQLVCALDNEKPDPSAALIETCQSFKEDLSSAPNHNILGGIYGGGGALSPGDPIYLGQSGEVVYGTATV